MTDPRPPRVRVTAPPAAPRRRTPVSAQREIDDQTEVGLIFLRSLLRAQLRLAAGVITTLVLVVATIPVLIHLLPGLARRQVLGMPLAWVLLACGVYPVLMALGLFFVRRAERNEDAFTDVIERP